MVNFATKFLCHAHRTVLNLDDWVNFQCICKKCRYRAASSASCKISKCVDNKACSDLASVFIYFLCNVFCLPSCICKFSCCSCICSYINSSLIYCKFMKILRKSAVFFIFLSVFLFRLEGEVNRRYIEEGRACGRAKLIDLRRLQH